MSHPKIYVAGHRGMVGSAIVRNLIASGHPADQIIGRTHAELDLTNQLSVDRFFAEEKPEYVFMAAAKVGGINANNKYRADFIYQNLQIQNNVIHASFINKVTKLIFLGSSCIYPKNALQPLKEDCLLTDELEYTNEPYAIAKIAGIKMCESYNLQYGTNYIAVMPTNLYGENDNFDLKNSHVIPAMIRKMYLAKLLDEDNYEKISINLQISGSSDSEVNKLLSSYGITKNEKVTTLKLWGTGEVYREFLHVDDMADACVFVMNNVNFKGLCDGRQEIRNTHINIGSGKEIKLKDLALMIAGSSQFKGKIEFDHKMPDGTPRKLLDVSKLAQLGWTAKINLADSLKKLIIEQGR